MDATDKISNALESLKSDLNELRNQDVFLMEKLIGINDTVRKMKKRPTYKIKTNYHPTPPVVWKMYQEAGPSFPSLSTIRSCGSQSSIEGDWSSSDDLSCISSLSDSDDETMPDSPWKTLRKPYSKTVTYKEMLMKNIKMWKLSHAVSSESLNSVLSDYENTALKETQV